MWCAFYDKRFQQRLEQVPEEDRGKYVMGLCKRTVARYIATQLTADQNVAYAGIGFLSREQTDHMIGQALSGVAMTPREQAYAVLLAPLLEPLPPDDLELLRARDDPAIDAFATSHEMTPKSTARRRVRLLDRLTSSANLARDWASLEHEGPGGR